MRRFGTQGRVYPDKHYVVPRTEEIADFINRVKEGRYIVLFAPRQTGKTTFFRLALEALATQDTTCFPIQLDFQVVRNTEPATFYERLYYMIRQEIESVFQRQENIPSAPLRQLLEETQLTDDFSMIIFFQQLSSFIQDKRVVIVIDEFDGIPQTVVSGFLYALRHIYLSDEPRCPHSVGIIGVKSINQLNYDRSVSPFNIQDEFNLPNFTLEQVQELLGQYTDEVGQDFAPEVAESIHKQTAGQPVLVNRFAQILTEELDIPKTETITTEHFTAAHAQLLQEPNTNINHLTTNIRKNPRFESVLMRIMPQESVGLHLLLAYLDAFVKRIGGVMHIEVETGRGRMDLLITHNQRKYIVETKVWRGENRYQAGKKQLAAYLKLEGAIEGYYVVFDHRQMPEPRVETETVEGVSIRSYVIPVVQEAPSNMLEEKAQGTFQN